MIFLLLLFISLLHIFISPFTKVEESFNIQAIHDFLQYKLNVSKFDHIAFPGVVPRTFMLPLFVSLLSWPAVQLNSILSLPKHYQQYIARIIITILSVVGHYIYAGSLRKVSGRASYIYYFVITISQFHINFYSSRTLPNTFALIVSLISTAFYLRRQLGCFVIFSGIAVMLVRSELSILFGLMLLPVLITKGAKSIKLLFIALTTAIAILAISIPIDSYFWQRICWPEFEVLWFNTILNKSSDWGTEPFLWYFYSALPRCLLATSTLVVGNFVFNRKSKMTEMSVFALVFVFIYSILPHKEVRFIIYVVPILNGAAAHCWQFIYEKSEKSLVYKTMHRLCWLLVLINVAVTTFLLTVSHFNYPGGEAVSRLNLIQEIASKNVHVHIGNLAAQTGMTRFLEEHRHWIYNKTEHIDTSPRDMSLFSHVIIESADTNRFLAMMTDYDHRSYKLLFEVYSFAGLAKQWPFYRLNSALTVLEKT